MADSHVAREFDFAKDDTHRYSISLNRMFFNMHNIRNTGYVHVLHLQLTTDKIRLLATTIWFGFCPICFPDYEYSPWLAWQNGLWVGPSVFKQKNRDEMMKGLFLNPWFFIKRLKMGMRTVLDQRGRSGLCQQHHPDQEGHVESFQAFSCLKSKLWFKGLQSSHFWPKQNDLIQLHYKWVGLPKGRPTITKTGS